MSRLLSIVMATPCLPGRWRAWALGVCGTGASSMRSCFRRTASKTLISHGFDNTVRFWDVDTLREVRRLAKQKDNVTCLALSRDDRLLFTGSGTGIIRQWLAPIGLEMRQLTGHPGAVKRLVLSPNGKQLISAGMDGSVRVWDVAKGTPVRVLEAGAAANGGFGFDVALALAPDGSLLAIGATGRSISLWDMTTLKDLRWLPEIQARGSLLAFSPNGKVLAVGERNFPTTIRLLGVATGKELRQLDFQHGELQTLAFSPDGKFLAGGCDHNVRLWEVAGARELHAAGGHFGSLHSIHFAQDGKTALSTANDRTARVWDTATGKELGRIEAPRLSFLGGGVLTDGKSFINGGPGGIVHLELADGVGREMRQLQMPKQIALLTSVVMSPDGKWLAATSGPVIALWNLAAGGELRQWTAAGIASTLTFSPDSRLLVSSSAFAPTQIWDVPAGKLVRQLAAPRGSNALAFSADGATLATYDNSVRRQAACLFSRRQEADLRWLGFEHVGLGRDRRDQETASTRRPVASARRGASVALACRRRCGQSVSDDHVVGGRARTGCADVERASAPLARRQAGTDQPVDCRSGQQCLRQSSKGHERTGDAGRNSRIGFAQGVAAPPYLQRWKRVGESRKCWRRSRRPIPRCCARYELWRSWNMSTARRHGSCWLRSPAADRADGRRRPPVQR
jgi:WD40 repeat protein